MGFLRFILTAMLALFALIAGLFAALLVAVTGIIASIFKGPRTRHSTPRQNQPRPRTKQPLDADVIDVDASEVQDNDKT